MKIIYETPETWGDQTQFFDDTVADELIASLREAGEDWGDIDISECHRWQQIELGSDIYEEIVRYPERAMFVEDGAGYYARVDDEE